MAERGGGRDSRWETANLYGHDAMRPPATWLTELTEASVVKILSGRGGTGFFVAPETIITCAHVVTTGKTVTAENVIVADRHGSQLTGSVEAMPSQYGRGNLWAYPDLCVIRLLRPLEDQPVVPLGETSGDPEVYLTGFTDVYENSRPGTVGARFSGSQGLVDGTARRIIGCSVPDGLSGGPVVDRAEGVVCGMVKATGARGTNEGLAIPAGAIKQYFSDIWEWNRQFGDPGGQWRALRNALRDGADSRHYWLTETEWRALTEAAGRLDYQNRKFSQLWRAVVGPHVPQLDRPLIKVEDLLEELSDRPGDGKLDPLVKLFEIFANPFDGDLESSLKGHAENIAARCGQSMALTEYRRQQTRHDRPVIVIRLEPAPEMEKEEVNLTAWAYDYWNAPQRQVSSELEYGPHSVENVKDAILQVLHREVGEPPTMIQLVLPDHMLDEEVEKWPLDGFPLGIRYPVVVRFTEWPGESGGNGKKVESPFASTRERPWRGRFESLRMPSGSSWSAHWTDCSSTRSETGLYGMLNSGERPPLIAMTAWHDGDPVPIPVQVARKAGVPVIIWRHNACKVRNLAVCNGARETCAGSIFRQEMIKNLSGVSFGKLPEEIQRVRAKAAENEDPELGLGVALLWDEPERIPWADPPPSQVPTPAAL